MTAAICQSCRFAIPFDVLWQIWESCSKLKDGKWRSSRSYLFPLPLGWLIHLSAPAERPCKPPAEVKRINVVTSQLVLMPQRRKNEREDESVLDISISYLDCFGVWCSTFRFYNTLRCGFLLWREREKGETSLADGRSTSEVVDLLLNDKWREEFQS